jgi:hypothetical protein
MNIRIDGKSSFTRFTGGNFRDLKRVAFIECWMFAFKHEKNFI